MLLGHHPFEVRHVTRNVVAQYIVPITMAGIWIVEYSMEQGM
jgi:hypothetical protein